MLGLDDLQVFVRTADRGSLSAAAREIGISPALASAAVKRLEGALGLRLLRTGHDALLAGRIPVAPSQVAVPAQRQRPVGRHGAPASRYCPALRTAGRFEHGLPIAPANDRVLVASPAYLRALEDGMHDRWTFYRLPQREQVSVQVSGNRSADDAELVRRWAVAGLGIAYKSRLDVAGDVAAGRLQVLLPEVVGEATPLQLLCMHRARVTPLVLQLRDFLRDKCAQ